MQESLPLSLCVHFPWCVAKCPYCDFNSHSVKGELPAREYVDALIAELEVAAAVLEDRCVSSVFLGGGTPSLFPPEEIARLMATAGRYLQLAPDTEVTMEANPGAVEHGAFSGYRQAGVNRLSLGVQSFNDAKLRSLGRIHDSEAAAHAFREARTAGFTNINLDLMYALPDQTPAEALADVSAALALAPEHISYYHLTLEPNTIFYSRPPRLPDQDAAWEIQARAAEMLSSAGYANYEVSAWARQEQMCRHNLNYWQFGDYLGIGAGAHGKLTSRTGRVAREKRAAHPREYLRRLQSSAFPGDRHEVQAKDLLFEFMLNALRLRAGFTLSLFEQRTGLPADTLRPWLQKAAAKQLLVEGPAGHWQASDRGWRFLDDLQGMFLPEDQDSTGAERGVI
jgi:putative oxygen-independent coproporphyrinogen III oxidase